MAFKATDGYGRGLDCDGVIVDQQNDTITHFQSLHDGMGNFQFKPEKNKSYFAILRLNDSLIKQKIPEPVDQGFVMSVEGNEGDTLSINVRATPDLYNTTVYLFVQIEAGCQKRSGQNDQSRGNSFSWLRGKILADGISSITLFNQQGQPVCERLVFKRPRERLILQVITGSGGL